MTTKAKSTKTSGKPKAFKPIVTLVLEMDGRATKKRIKEVIEGQLAGISVIGIPVKAARVRAINVD